MAGFFPDADGAKAEVYAQPRSASDTGDVAGFVVVADQPSGYARWGKLNARRLKT